MNPFAQKQPADYAHPFGRVPVLVHGSSEIYETGAILTHVTTGFPDPALIPAMPLAQA